MKLSQALEVLSQCDFPGYAFSIYKDGIFFLLQGIYFERDAAKPDNPIPVKQLTRIWAVPIDWTPDQLIQTVFKCVLTSKEHSVREHFKYRGKAIFGPHFKADDLVKLCE